MTQDEKIKELELNLEIALNRITQLEIRINSIPYNPLPLAPGVPPHYPWWWPAPAYAVRMTDNTSAGNK
jgi:hypothetical protein